MFELHWGRKFEQWWEDCGSNLSVKGGYLNAVMAAEASMKICFKRYTDAK